MPINEKIRGILQEKGMTQVELAEKMGVQTSQLSRIMTGKTQPTLETLENIANALDVPMMAFYDDNVQVNALVESLVKELPQDLIDFIKSRPNAVWLYLAKDLSDYDISPEDIRNLVQMWKSATQKGNKST